jgi:hypothetical protein
MKVILPLHAIDGTFSCMAAAPQQCGGQHAFPYIGSGQHVASEVTV